MKIKNKNILTNVFIIGLILGIGLFALQNLNLILTKLRFVEIADDMNASFLEMRLSEKNYFLYHRRDFLIDIREKIESTGQLLESAGPDIVRAIGKDNFALLKTDLKNYSDVVEEEQKNPQSDVSRDSRFRAEGQRLREFSSTITRLERKGVNDIISKSKSILIVSFCAILSGAVFVSHLISRNIRLSLREIEKIAKSISDGNFSRIEHAIPDDEFGLVMAAINAMSYELQNREEALIQSKKLASLGILTAGVAHELTNPLNNISMMAQTYLDMYDSLDKTQRIEFMAKVENETERIQEIIKNLLDFSKPKEANLKESDINKVVQKALKLVQNMLDISNIETKLSLSGDLPHVFIDDYQIQQVLVNLVTNSVQAMHEGGKLFMSTRPGGSADSVEVTVMDTGKGIPPEFLLHIFDPFFSTKGEGGTGLGLSVSYGIIKNHKGDIRVESKVGVGTTFTIELPIYKNTVVSSR
ncbi:MAG: HAMP domain-containing protein [Nitrospirae bacterium]|nr:HAMP domain-containing protein [Nitrospirota bacterium]